VFGVMARKNWSSVAGLRSNCTASKYFGHRPMRNWLNQSCSSGVGLIVASTRLRAAAPRRGWSINTTPNRRRRKMFWKPSRPSEVLSQVLEDWPAPCSMTMGSLRAFTGV